MYYLPIERKHHQIVFLKDLALLQLHLLVMQPYQPRGAIIMTFFIWMVEDTNDQNTFK